MSTDQLYYLIAAIFYAFLCRDSKKSLSAACLIHVVIATLLAVFDLFK